MSSVLRHVVKYRPNWNIDFQAEQGRECVGRGIVNNVFVYGQQYPSEHYDSEVQIILYDTWAGWTDRPNTRVSSCLHERFGLPWDESLGRYQIQIREKVKDETHILLNVIEPWPRDHSHVVAFHYLGDSASWRKNLTHDQAKLIAKTINSLGKIPLMLDWRNSSPLKYDEDICTVGGMQLSLSWGKNPEYNCALISQCAAFIGIDSGPGKCASATDTPSLIIWTDHHPSQFHDPAPNTTHLVPVNYHSMHPVLNDPGVIKWFESHYNVRTYESNPCEEVGKWLKEVLT